MAPGEPARHRKAERVIERRIRDAGVVEAPAGGGPEPRHAPGKFLERAVDALEDLGIVGVYLEEAQRLVETRERPWPPDGPTGERVEQAELLLPRGGLVARCDGGQGVHEPPARQPALEHGPSHGPPRRPGPRCAPSSRRPRRSNYRSRAPRVHALAPH